MLFMCMIFISNRYKVLFSYFLHADCAVPFVIIFGGTDLNEHYRESAALEVMTKAVRKAKYMQILPILVQCFVYLKY